MGFTKSSEIPGSKPNFPLFNPSSLKGLTAHHNNPKGIDDASSRCNNHSPHNNHNDRRNNNQKKEESKEEEGVKEEGIHTKKEADKIGVGPESKKWSEEKKWPKEATCRWTNLKPKYVASAHACETDTATRTFLDTNITSSYQNTITTI